MANRVRRTVASLRFEELTDDFAVQLSAGVACRQVGESMESLVTRADAALYDAKQGGRDRTVVAPDGPA